MFEQFTLILYFCIFRRSLKDKKSDFEICVELVQDLKKRGKAIESEHFLLKDMSPNNFIFIFKSDVLVREFNQISDEIVGFDGYFKGNIEKRPLFVLSYVNKSFRSIPLALALCSSENKEMMYLLFKILKETFKIDNYTVSIDYDESEIYGN